MQRAQVLRVFHKRALKLPGGDPLVPIDETVEPTFEDGSKEKSIPGQELTRLHQTEL